MICVRLWSGFPAENSRVTINEKTMAFGQALGTLASKVGQGIFGQFGVREDGLMSQVPAVKGARERYRRSVDLGRYSGTPIRRRSEPTPRIERYDERTATSEEAKSDVSSEALARYEGAATPKVELNSNPNGAIPYSKDHIYKLLAAEGNGFESMVGVAETMRNSGRLFGENGGLTSAYYEPLRSGKGKNYDAAKPGTERYEMATKALKAALGGSDLTGGATHNYAGSVSFDYSKYQTSPDRVQMLNGERFYTKRGESSFDWRSRLQP